MTKDDLASLQPGDLIRHKHCGATLVVTGNYGDRVTAVRSYDVANAVEWERVEVQRRSFRASSTAPMCP